jgi:hypothetical protein
VREMVLPAIERHGPIEGLDHRRYKLSEEGRALRRRGAAVLRPTRQTGELPDGGIAVACQCSCEPAGGLTLVPAGELGVGCRAPPEGRGAGGDRLSDQAANRARSDPCGLRGGLAARRGADGRWLWQSLRSAHGGYSARIALHCRDFVEHHGLGARHGSPAAQDRRPRGAPVPDSAPRPELDRRSAPKAGNRHRPAPVAMSMLREESTPKRPKLMTQ